MLDYEVTDLQYRRRDRCSYGFVIWTGPLPVSHKIVWTWFKAMGWVVSHNEVRVRKHNVFLLY